VAAESLFVVPDSAEFNQDLKRWAVAHADTVRAWRLDGTVDGLPLSRWIDAAGMVVQARYAVGAVMERSAFEMVQTNFRSLPAPKWDTTASAPQYLPDSSSPPVRRALKVVARLIQPDQSLPPDIRPLQGGWQTRTGDTIRVARPGPDAPVDSLPDSKDLALWSLFQGDSALRDAAIRASGRESRPEAVANALDTWVRRKIGFRKGPGMNTPSRVLATGRGNEMERVLLLTALAQSAGMRARPVWGLVLVQGRWELRSWAEIWANRWVPFDPALEARGIDAGRVRLATSGSARLMDLALHAGRLRLDVLEATR
jgi:Transglutaminase-like superfamily